MICDNLSSHKAPVVQRWLLALPRFVLHFTPTYSSWINQVERWLAELHARPFTWTRTPDQIIDRTCRYCPRISKPARSAVLTACLRA